MVGSALRTHHQESLGLWDSRGRGWGEWWDLGWLAGARLVGGGVAEQAPA
jgi:hypothetical protein